MRFRPVAAVLQRLGVKPHTIAEISRQLERTGRVGPIRDLGSYEEYLGIYNRCRTLVGANETETWFARFVQMIASRLAEWEDSAGQSH